MSASAQPVPRPLTADDVSDLRAVLVACSPFRIRYGNVHDTRPYPGVVYAIEPAGRILELRDRVHSVALFPSSPRSRERVRPHMTIAEFISMDESAALAGRLRGIVPEGDWLCQDIEYAAPDEQMRFRRVMSFQLGALAVPIRSRDGCRPSH